PPARIYPLSLHDALPILRRGAAEDGRAHTVEAARRRRRPARLPRRFRLGRRSHREPDHPAPPRKRVAVLDERLPEHERRHEAGGDRKSTRLNSSHEWISY